MKAECLGEFEQLVLLAIVQLGADAYGMTIRRQIEDRTGRSVSIGALYTALERLERKGYVGSTMTGPRPGGRAAAMSQQNRVRFPSPLRGGSLGPDRCPAIRPRRR